MIFCKTGFVKDNLYVAGFPWSPVYLLDSQNPIIFEAGFSCMGKYYKQDIVKFFSAKKPEFLFITHVHYDHCGAASYFKKVFGSMDIGVSQQASEIIKRPNALKLMGDLSNNVLQIIENMNNIDKDKLLRDKFEPFEPTMILGDGQIINLHKEISVNIIATPGHTRDMLSFYVPEKKLLIATESAGCMGHTGSITTEFLVNYDLYIKSLIKLASLEVDILCQGHHFVFTGQDVKKHFEKSIISAKKFKEIVDEFLQSANGSIEAAVSMVKSQEYDSNPGPKQPEKAYLLNLTQRVTHLAERIKLKDRNSNV